MERDLDWSLPPEKERYDALFHCVLYQPEIPQNTGNIGRTCVGAQSHLHLIKPFKFEITDKNLKRSGLDYWPHLQWTMHEGFDEWMSQVPDPSRVFYFSKKATHSLYETRFQKGDSFVFGPETKGLPEEMLTRNGAQSLKIPLLGPIRSLNLATAVAIGLFEGIRQLDSDH